MTEPLTFFGLFMPDIPDKIKHIIFVNNQQAKATDQYQYGINK